MLTNQKYSRKNTHLHIVLSMHAKFPSDTI